MLLAVVVAVGAVAALVLVAMDGGDGKEKKRPIESSSRESEPTPSLSIPSELPSEVPTDLPTEVPSLPTDFPSDIDSLIPTPAAGEVPYYRLKTGDCFDVDAGKPGRAAKKPCGTPHDAEVVAFATLKGSYTTNAQLKKAASDYAASRSNARRAASRPAPYEALWCSTRMSPATGSASMTSRAAWRETPARASTSSPSRCPDLHTAEAAAPREAAAAPSEKSGHRSRRPPCPRPVRPFALARTRRRRLPRGAGGGVGTHRSDQCVCGRVSLILPLQPGLVRQSR
ncbi:hypothetical protein AB0I16_12300 [Streptomyces sp. NPDC050703]|uniref:hypothetical protein n=1 Tax=Streptomyces sp. NPDC050703 TaxID=3157218 RepID=UPI003420D0B5